MHLFGATSGPHLAHFHAWRHGDSAVLEWEVRNSPPLRWRILRSTEGYAESAEPPGENGQTLVTDDTQTHCTDEGLSPSASYFYTIFAENEKGDWQRQVETKLHHLDALRWLHPDAAEHLEIERDLEANPLLTGPPSVMPPSMGGGAAIVGASHGRDAGTELGEYLRCEAQH